MRPRLFSEPQAKHYCSKFNASVGATQDSIENYQRNVLGDRTITIVEGSSQFDNYRDCTLREIERSLFLSISHYRRSLDLMIASASPWLHVTLYYGTFYAAKALLAMFGCSILNKKVIDVERGNPGNQKLILRRMGNATGQIQYPSNNKGTHQVFWEFFYQAVTPLKLIVDTNFVPSLTPVNSNPTWFIEIRNQVNYRTSESMSHIENFYHSFSSSSFPHSLSGNLATQYEKFQLLLELTTGYAKDFGISTDVLDFLPPNNNFAETVGKYIYSEKSPSLVRKTIKSFLTSK
jgi:hypothetical protein